MNPKDNANLRIFPIKLENKSLGYFSVTFGQLNRLEKKRKIYPLHPAFGIHKIYRMFIFFDPFNSVLQNPWKMPII